MGRRKRRKDLECLNTFLETALKRRKIHLSLQDPYLTEPWNNAVGDIIAAQTYPYRLRHGILFVHVSTSTWMHQLHFMKQEIIEKVNSFLDASPVKDIRFSIGRIPTPKHRETPDFQPPDTSLLRPRDRRMISESLESIADDELKTILERVMTREIINRREREK